MKITCITLNNHNTSFIGAKKDKDRQITDSAPSMKAAIIGSALLMIPAAAPGVDNIYTNDVYEKGITVETPKINSERIKNLSVQEIQQINKATTKNVIKENNKKIILTTLLRDLEICPFSFDRENEFVDIFTMYDLVNLPVPMDGSLAAVINHTGFGRFNTTKIFTYDNQNRISEIKHEKKLDWDTNKKFTYDSKGRITSIKHNTAIGKWDTSRKHTYDSNNRLVHIERERGLTEWDTSRDLEYDKKGRLIKIKNHKPFGEWDTNEKISYNSTGKISRVEHCKGPMTPNSKTNFLYDNSNKLSRVIYDIPFDYNESKEFIYNRKGQLSKIINHTKIGEFNTSTLFEYDSKGRLKTIKHKTAPDKFNQSTEFIYKD